VLAVLLFLPMQKAEYFLREGWTANREACPTGKSARVHSVFRVKRTCADAMKMDEEYPIDVVMVGAKRALAKTPRSARANKRPPLKRAHSHPMNRPMYRSIAKPADQSRRMAERIFSNRGKC
jgi:hypothetical protein